MAKNATREMTSGSPLKLIFKLCSSAAAWHAVSAILQYG